MSDKKTVYACTFYEKTVTVDHYETGCEFECSCVANGRLNLTAPTLPSLLERIANYLCIDEKEFTEDVFIGGDGDDDKAHIIGFNRMENSEGEPPTERESKDWTDGRLTLYLADYTFSMEKRIVESVMVSEFESVGIATH